MPSPTPIYFTGTWSSWAMAMTMPPLAVPSSLVRTMPVMPGGLLELLGLDQAVLAGGGVQHQQGLPVAAGQLPVDDPADLVQLVHQVLLVVQPSGGVDQDHVGPPGLGGGQGVEDHGGGVGPLVLADDLHPRCAQLQISSWSAAAPGRCRRRPSAPACPPPSAGRPACRWWWSCPRR